MQAAGTYSGLAQYQQLLHTYKVPVAEFEAAVTAVKEAKSKTATFAKSTAGLKEFVADPEFKSIYIRGIAKNEGIPTREELEEKVKKAKGTKFEPILKKALKYVEEISAADLKTFNTNFKDVLVKAKAYYKAGAALDAKLLEVNKIMKDHASAQNVQDCGAFVGTSVDHRAKMYKVYNALQKLNSVEEKAIKEAAKYQKAVDTENSANVALIIFLVLLVLGTVGGVTYCKCAKKACFAEKEEGETAEGGQSDRAIFKKEVKSKKKNNKESLVPSFKVADEQA